jgi:hypothetical protein
MVREGEVTSWNGSDARVLGFLVNCLEQVQTLRDPASRRLCLDLLADNLGVALVVDDLPTARAHLMRIVYACRHQHQRGLTALMEVVEQLEPGSLPLQRARAAVDDMTLLSLIDDQERKNLLELLDGSPGEQLAELMRSMGGPAAAYVPSEHQPAAVLTALERMNARPGGVPPLLAFVERVATCFDDRRTKRLRQWNDRQAERMGLIDELQTVRTTQVTEPPAPKHVVACLVVRIEPDLLEPEILVVAHWRQNDPVRWLPQRGESFSGNLTEVHSHVAELVAEAETGWAKDAEAIRIEFLLPYSLLNLPVDQWDLATDNDLPRPLGLHYQVVIRSLDRARSPRWHREWRLRWDLFKQLPSGQRTPSEHWAWSNGAKPRQLMVLDAKLAARKDVLSLVLRSPPNGDQPGEVVVGVQTGIPVMIWQRADSGRFAFEAEVRAMRDALPELVENLRQLRSRARQAARPDSHVGSRISVLWDDPDRPVEPLDPPAAPAEEAPGQ